MTVSSECPYIWQGEAPGLTLNPHVQPEPRDLEWAEPGSNARSAPCWVSHLRQDPGLLGLSTILASWGCWYPSQQDNVHPVSGKTPWHVVGTICCPQTPPRLTLPLPLQPWQPWTPHREGAAKTWRDTAEASTQGPGLGHRPSAPVRRRQVCRRKATGGSVAPYPHSTEASLVLKTNVE